jgi:hypothetical protein
VPRPATRELADLVRDGVLDAELAGLLAVLVDRGLPLVVAGPGAPARTLLATLRDGETVTLADPGDPDPRTTARALLHRAGEGLPTIAVIDAASLEGLYARLRAAPIGLTDDDLTGLGIVVVLGEGDRVAAAHWVRPLARDVHGHLQRLGPAVLAARDSRTGQLEHYAWGVIPELAIRLGTTAVELESAIADWAIALGATAAPGADRTGAGDPLD